VLRIVRSREELAQRVAGYFDDPERARQDGARGQEVINQSRGAVAQLVEMVVPLINRQDAGKDASAAGSRAS
jgi:hypothetical protein